MYPGADAAGLPPSFVETTEPARRGFGGGLGLGTAASTNSWSVVKSSRESALLRGHAKVDDEVGVRRVGGGSPCATSVVAPSENSATGERERVAAALGDRAALRLSSTRLRRLAERVRLRCRRSAARTSDITTFAASFR